MPKQAHINFAFSECTMIATIIKKKMKFWPLLTEQLKTWQETGWERGEVTHSKGPQVGTLTQGRRSEDKTPWDACWAKWRPTHTHFLSGCNSDSFPNSRQPVCSHCVCFLVMVILWSSLLMTTSQVCVHVCVYNCGQSEHARASPWRVWTI